MLDDLNEKEVNDPREQAIFVRFRHNISSHFVISQEFYELPKRTIRANGNNYHIFKPNHFRDVEKRYQNNASIDMTLNGIKNLTSTCWNEKYQPLTIDRTNDKHSGRYRLGINSFFFPDSSPF